MGGLFLRLRTWWVVADRTQRTVSTAGLAFLALLVAGTFMFASKPKMDVLAAGLSPAEQGVIMQELQKTGVPAELNSQGMVTVPSDQVARVRADLAAKGKMPLGDSGLGADFAKMSMMTTPRVEKEQLKSMLEARLAETVEFLDFVESARVSITLPDDSAFVSERRPATASVAISERGAVPVGGDQGRSIAMLVANAVPGLDLSGISVINRRGEAIYDGQDRAGTNGNATAKLETEKVEAKRRERELQQKLDTAFGPGTTAVSVNLELDLDKVNYTEVTYPSDPKKLPTQKTEETMPSGDVGGYGGGVAAPATEDAGAPTAAGSKEYKNKQEAFAYVTDERRTQVEQASGNVKTMAINVLVDSSKIKDPNAQTAVENFVIGYLGPKAADTKNFTYKVTPVEFDSTVTAIAAKASAEAAGKQKMQQIFSLLPIGALVIVGLLVLKGLSKLGKQNQVFVATADGQVLPVPHQVLTRNVSVKELQAAADGSYDVQSLAAVATGDPSAPKKRRIIEDDDDDEGDEAVRVKKIKEKLDVPLEQIKLMGRDKPETVAMLIKSWLLEEGIRR